MATIRSVALSAALGAIGAGLMGQTASRGRNEFYEFDSMNARLLGDGKVKVTVLGSPLKGDFTVQRMKVTASKFVGTVEQRAGGRMAVLEAQLTGSVVLESARPSASKQSGALQTMVMSTATATYLGETEKVVFPGAVSIRQTDPAAGNSLTANATSGSANLLSAGQVGRFGVRSMQFEGPVVWKQTSAASKPNLPPQVLNGRSDRMSYDEAAGALTLTGNVRMDGNHPLMFGDIQAAKVVVKFDATGRVEEIDVMGSPATTNVQRKPPPPTGGRR